jgi:hypothetical protein
MVNIKVFADGQAKKLYAPDLLIREGIKMPKAKNILYPLGRCYAILS